ncbi:metallophosphoesterase [Longimycelium tulufanense]|uniref:Metallophosphoesterase n=1 Tax=Longimycelium tulufanense TaxID=907463 RepID=A0A8J3FUD1_9PSEU|nr:metallophosphoesterase [Longimycelium tulufanense]GGM42613.1 metallophosphoesterase [Longimycelium tulufanense]
MARVLAVSDEVVEQLWTDKVRELDVDLVLAAGDLPFDYLEFLVDALDRPGVLVPGNHDPDLTGYRNVRGLWTRAGMPARWPGPRGWVDADGRVVEVGGLRIAGLGGSIRYRQGPNQWTERQQARRVRRLVRRSGWRRPQGRRGIDVLLTHSPPRHCGDREDPAHQGFECLHQAVQRLRPRVLLHGHIHPHGEETPDRALHDTLVLNTVGYRLLEITPATTEVTGAR